MPFSAFNAAGWESIDHLPWRPHPTQQDKLEKIQ